MRVLGIDPGLTRCGVGVVEGETGRPLRLVDVGVVRTSSDLPVAQRLVSIERALDAWIEEHRPTWWRWSGCSRAPTSAR
jgi:crossover junction endodeoxyribonuclease RuvC